MKYSLLFSLIISLLISSCKKEDVEPISLSEFQNATFPFLNVGNKWSYYYDSFFDSGTLIMEVGSVLNNKYKVSFSYNDASPSYQYWYADGQYLKTSTDANPTGKPIFKFNPSLNDSWQHPGSSNNTIFYKVVKLNDTIATSLDTYYDCVKIEVTFSDAFNTQYNYWSKQYGEVYQDGVLSLDLFEKNF